MWPTRTEARRISITTDDPAVFADHVQWLVSHTDPTGQCLYENRLVLLAMAESLMAAGPTVRAGFQKLARDVYVELGTQIVVEFDMSHYLAVFKKRVL